MKWNTVLRGLLLIVGVNLVAHVASTPGDQDVLGLLGGAVLGLFIVAEDWA